jgi:bifunctional UDP-N-acetylglucosamine pyrophosphorylase/glucosamine-1-phosphate N-acetyltransferase
MPDLHVLIAAAGKGSRAGLPYPKTLYPIQGKPILVRLHELLAHLDHSPTVIVSPSGKEDVASCLAEYGYAAHLIVQAEPRGMGEAVLQFRSSPAYADANDVLLVWGDIPFIQPKTVASVVDAHRLAGNDFTLATRMVDAAYTIVTRDAHGKVLRVTETREMGAMAPHVGERDIGLFVFRKQPVFDLLQQDLPGKYGKATGEHGFLYVIEHLVGRGFRVEGLPIATELDLVSLNALADIKTFL